MKTEYDVKSIGDLGSFAAAFLRAFPEPGIFAVKGEMGAGKTTTIAAICAGMGIEETSSPTFAIVNEYESEKKVKVYHFDLYRLKSIREASDIGIEEYLASNAYLFIEWPDLIEPLLPLPYYEMRITAKEEGRQITITQKNQ